MSRYYSTPLGRLPSVTTILSATMPQHRRVTLDLWLQGSGALKKQDEGRSRGNALDAWAKAYLLGRSLPALDYRYARHARWLRAYLDYVKRSAADVACDVQVYSGLGYAGTVDLLWRNQAGFWIVEDIKTCTRLHPQSVSEAQLQAIAYATALREMGYSVAAIAPIYVTPTECKAFLTNDPLLLDALFLKWMSRLTQYRQYRHYEHSAEMG